MPRRWLAVAAAACVLLAGCGGSPPPTTPENPQTTLQPSTSKTLSDPLYRLEVRNRDDGPVQVEIALTHPGNGSVFYETEQTLQSDALRDYSHRFPDDRPVRVTVRVAEDSVTRVVGPEEGYAIAVQNSSDIDVYSLPDSSETTATTSRSTERVDAGLRISSSGDEPVTVRLRVSTLDGDVVHRSNRTVAPGAELYLDHLVAERAPVEVTVAVNNDSVSREVFQSETLLVDVSNASAVSATVREYSS